MNKNLNNERICSEIFNMHKIYPSYEINDILMIMMLHEVSGYIESMVHL